MDPQAALARLQEPALHDLSILSLSEPILNVASKKHRSPSKRYSNADKVTQTPASLAADLAHYQELFSKLRFSYVEQITKERFLSAVTAEQPEFVSAAENVELEARLRGDKDALKQKKLEVREIISALEEQGRQLAKSEYSSNEARISYADKFQDTSRSNCRQHSLMPFLQRSPT